MVSIVCLLLACEGEHVHLDLVAGLTLQDDRLAQHGVLVVGLVVLVVEGGHLVPVPPDGHQGLVHVVGADVDGEHVGAGEGSREHPGLGVHAGAEVGVGSCKRVINYIIVGYQDLEEIHHKVNNIQCI